MAHQSNLRQIIDFLFFFVCILYMLTKIFSGNNNGKTVQNIKMMKFIFQFFTVTVIYSYIENYETCPNIKLYL